MFGLISSGYFSAVTVGTELTFAPTDASAAPYTAVDANSTAAFCMLLAAYGSQGSDLDQVFGAYRCVRAHMACLLLIAYAPPATSCGLHLTATFLVRKVN